MPPILAGILGIYGLVVSVVITSLLNEKSALHTNFLFLASGIAVGLSCLAAGFCIGIVGDAGVRATGQQPRMFVGMMMMLIFAEVLGELCPLFSSVVRELEEV
jgi:V-type H+-transporting ATPase proteolipid subunit